MSNPSFGEKGPVVGRMLALCARLRGEGGCAWDRAQTLTSLTPYLLEEAHEVGEAALSGGPDAIREELGDLLYVTIFALHAAETEGIGSVEEIVDSACEKLRRRHPHVFGDSPTDDPARARREWQRAKRSEAPAAARSALGTPPGALPALLSAFRLQEKASAVGFDWTDVEGPLEKVREELAEVQEVLDDPERAGEELGDLLFAVANVARFLRTDPEAVLRSANRRFYERFRHIEERLAETGRNPEQASLEEMEALWEEAKSRPRTDPARSEDAPARNEDGRGDFSPAEPEREPDRFST